jgi:hypothetical protein
MPMVHADGEFAPLKTLIESIQGVPMVNFASSNEHVPEIEHRIRVVKDRCRPLGTVSRSKESPIS